MCSSTGDFQVSNFRWIIFKIHLLISCFRQQSRIDRRSEPRIGERVPYIQSLPRACAPPTSAVPSEHSNSRKATISQYFGSSVCLLCDDPILTNGLCGACGSSRQTSAFSLSAMQRLREKDYTELISLCQSCTGNTRIERDCISMDCPVLYRRVKAFQNLQLVSKWRDALSLL